MHAYLGRQLLNIYVTLVVLWQTLNESVTSVCGGVVGSSQHDEVIVATYSGCVLGLTREQLNSQTLSKEVQSKLATLK